MEITNTEKHGVDKKLTENLIAQQKYAALESYIYSQYPKTSQDQDQIRDRHYSKKLASLGFENLEVIIFDKVSQFFAGKSSKELLEDAEDKYRYLLAEVVEIAIKTEWIDVCIIEGKLAMAEKRPPVFPEFPEIN